MISSKQQQQKKHTQKKTFLRIHRKPRPHPKTIRLFLLCFEELVRLWTVFLWQELSNNSSKDLSFRVPQKLPAHDFKCEEIMKAFSFWLNYPFNRLPDLLLNNPLNKICEINSTHQTENVINVSICFPHGSFAPLIWREKSSVAVVLLLSLLIAFNSS